MSNLVYPIRAVSKLTGLSIDTLRAWERRYGAVTPGRDGRGRTYTQADVQRLQLLHAAVEAGHAIGRIAGLSDRELQRLLSEPDSPQAAGAPPKLGRHEGSALDLTPILHAVERYDDQQADRELGRLSALLAPRQLVHDVALPLMRYVGSEWQKGRMSIAQEHLASALLRNLLGTVVRLSSRPVPAGRLLFATPSGEMHEFGILCAAMLACAGGLGVTYLGPNLPAAEILDAARRSLVQVIVLGVVGAAGTKALMRNVQEVEKGLPARTELWIGGAKSKEVERALRSTSAVYLEDFDALERQLAAVGARF